MSLLCRQTRRHRPVCAGLCLCAGAGLFMQACSLQGHQANDLEHKNDYFNLTDPHAQCLAQVTQVTHNYHHPTACIFVGLPLAFKVSPTPLPPTQVLLQEWWHLFIRASHGWWCIFFFIVARCFSVRKHSSQTCGIHLSSLRALHCLHSEGQH